MSPEASHEDHDALADRRSDQGQWNVTMGEIARKGFYADRTDIDSTTPKNKKEKIVAELDGDAAARKHANEFAANNPRPDDQDAINARGKANALANAVPRQKRW